MPNARRLLVSCALAGIALGAAACERQTTSTKPIEEHPPVVAAKQTHLWRIEVIQDGKPTSQLEICADRNVESSFVRPAPSIGGKDCMRVAEPVETDTTYSVRCRTDDQLYRVGSSTTGDRARAFTVEMAVTRQDKKGPTFEQVRRYSLAGACPAGWKIGDSAAPGATQVVNTLTGETRAIPAGA